MSGFFNFLGDIISNNPGKSAGIALGFIFGILIFTLGIVKTMIILLFVGIGFIIGKSRDENVSIIDEITGLFKRNKEEDDIEDF